jgi:hypothetical protein
LGRASPVSPRRRASPPQVRPAPTVVADGVLLANGHVELYSVASEGQKREIGLLCCDPMAFLSSMGERDIFVNEGRRTGPLDESENA